MNYVKKGFSVFLSLFLVCTMVFDVHVHAEETTTYQYSDTATSNGITLKIEWNEPVLGQETMFHVSASGGSGNYQFRMESPSYSNPDEWSFESVADSSRENYNDFKYTETCLTHDFTFTMMATGTYNFKFFLMDKDSKLYYLRSNTYISVSDAKYPSINEIAKNAVAQCKTNSEYETALNLHDWLLKKLDYDNTYKWSSAESALTRGLGTCQAYESAYARLLTVAGITNREIRDEYDNHTWNAAYLDGQWYQIDCTWDDDFDNYYGDFESSHVYFGLTDELMALAHKGHTNIYTASSYATRSTSLEDNYFVKNGKAQEWANNYKSEIETNLASKSTNFTIVATNASQPESISGIQNGIIAYVINSMNWNTDNINVTLSCVGEAKQFVFTVIYQEKCTEHIWNDGEITTSPTCTAKGVKTYICTNCGATKTVTIDALGHNYSSTWTVDKAATCAQEGSKSHHCTRCNAKKDVTTIAKLAHTWNGGTTTKKASYSENGNIQYTCIKCGTKKNESILSYIEEAKQNRSVISDGNYVIQSSLNSNYVLDINNGSTSNGANLQLYGANNTLAQAFRVSHDSNGFVTFTNLKSGKVLDVSDGIARNGKNVWQYGSNNTRAQKWIVKKNGNGYTIVSALDTNFVLDLSDGIVRNEKNIHIYTSNGTNAQKWYFTRYMTKEEKLNELANTNKSVISDGTYAIQSSLNSNYVLDVSNGSTENGANVQLYESNNTLAQAFKVTHDSNGYVTFTNVKSGKVLDVSDGIARNGKNVWQYGSNNTRAQKWIVKKNGNGYTIVSAIDSNYVLDLSDGIVQNGKNIHIYLVNGTNAQKWYFKKK